MTLFKEAIKFSNFVVTGQVFYKSKHTFALVNLRPIVPGHILIVPLRLVARLKDLTPEESIDYMNTIQHVHRFIEHIYQASSLNIAIQDGPEAGQSVPHLHTHVIPRHRENNIGDEMYEKLADFDAAQDFVKRREAVLKQQKEGKIVVKPDDARFDRDVQVMEDEAQWLAEELAKFYSK